MRFQGDAGYRESYAAISDEAFAIVELTAGLDPAGEVRVAATWCDVVDMPAAPLRETAAVLRQLAADLEQQADDVEAGSSDGA